MDAEFKGSSEHAAQHHHGVVPRTEPLAPQTVEQRVAKLEKQVAELIAANEAAKAAATANKPSAPQKSKAAD
jgi:hypothetical protein